MADAREQIGMVSIHGARLDHGARSTAILEALTALDIAAAMGMGCSEFEANLLLATYALDHYARQKAQGMWVAFVGKKWANSDRMASVTLDEHITPYICRTCQGVAMVQVGHKVIECQDCLGTGRVSQTDREIARLIGVSVSDYQKAWRGRVEWCRRELAKQEYSGLTALSSALEDA